MRQISVKSLRANISGELKDAPFSITKHGKAVWVLCTQLEYDSLKSVHNSETKPQSVHKSIEKCTQVKKVISEEVKAKVVSIEQGKLPKKATVAKSGGHDPHRIGKQRMEGE